MKKTKYIIFILIIALTSCIGIKKSVREYYKHELYIDFKNASYQGRNSTQNVYFEIDSTNGIWYHGKLIINSKDTILVRGFEKGHHYVTMYKKKELLHNGKLQIWTKGETGEIREQFTIEDRDTINGIIEKKTILYRQPRKNCH